MQAAFDWGEDRLPSTPLDHSLLLEVDVPTFSTQDTSVPADHRGATCCQAPDSVVELPHQGPRPWQALGHLTVKAPQLPQSGPAILAADCPTAEVDMRDLMTA